MMISRRPPTFIPIRPCLKPGTNPDAGWEISYLEPSTYQVNMSMRAFETMLERNPDKAEEIQLAALRFKLIEPTLPNGRAHAPVWEMHATRID